MNVAVGLSGGVDSSVAALLLKEQGHHVVGITMRLWDGKYKGGGRDACFGAGEERDIETAAAFAKAIGIEYRVFDCSREYDDSIVSYFRKTYLAGLTPNPCVRCNALFKFGILPDMAARSGLSFDRFATGHYARIETTPGGRRAIRRALDEARDQSYFLYRLSQSQLARQLFPLGDMRKVDVRAKAAAAGLAAATKPDSQDFYSGEISELIGEATRPGDIVDTHGKVVGHHDGFWLYTVGQRKGLKIGGAGEPYYVVDLDACRNRVIVGRADEAMRTEFAVTDMVDGALTAEERAGQRIECQVKIRSGGAPRGPAFLEGCRCEVPGGLHGVAPGQSAVFYDATGVIIAGGVIARDQ